MTRIEFFFNIGDKLQHVAVLSAKALSKGKRLMIFTEDMQAARLLETVLWSHPVTGFLPHCRCDSAFAGATPIIVDWQGKKLLHDDTLINLRVHYPPFFSRFQRLIELVGQDESDKIEARARYRFYQDRGYEIKSFDVSGAAL